MCCVFLCFKLFNNIPPLEAFKIGTPVIYPKLDGLKDQIQDAGILVDLHDPETLSTAIFDLIENKDYRNSLINKGFRMSKKLEKANKISTLNNILKNYLIKFSTFRNND